MRILWLTNLPSGGQKQLGFNSPYGGWMGALQDCLMENVDELGVAFFYKKNHHFTDGNIKYWAVKKTIKSKINAYIPMSIWDDEQFLLPFKNIIDEFNPDLIHIHGTEQELGLLQKIYPKIPFVISIQGILSVIGSKYFSAFSKQFLFKSQFSKHFVLKSFLSNHWRFYKKTKIEKKILQLSNNIIGRTYWDRCVTRVLAPQANYFHVDEILRPLFYNNRWSHHSTDFKLFSTVGSNVYKGLEVILKTAEHLNRLKINYSWRVAGVLFNDPIVSLSQKLCEVEMANISIDFIGIINEQEMVEELLNTSLYVQTSHIENSPNNLCEAMILGLPILTSDAGGTTSLISANEGVIIQGGDPISNAGAIIDIKENYEEAIERGKNARKRAMLRHNKDNIVKRLIEVYNNIIRQN